VARLPESDAQSAGLGQGQGGRWSSDPVPVTADAPLIEAFRLLGCDETCSITYVRACAGQMAVVGSSSSLCSPLLSPGGNVLMCFAGQPGDQGGVREGVRRYP
jgi:hypothetical protein